MSDKSVVDFESAKDRFEQRRKEKAAKALRKQFHSAMGWKERPKPRKNQSKGPTPPRGRKR